MARFNAADVDHYGGNGGGGFFGLKDHKDVATVRFMYNTIGDVEAFSVHEVEVDGKKRYVNCLREYNEPLEACPFCEAKMRVVPKIFVLIYDEDTQEVKIWDRGKTFYSKLSSLCGRHNPLVSTVFEIERNGKKGDQKTTYETYAISTDDTALEDLPETPEVLGSLVLDKDADEMLYFLDNGEFPEDEEDTRERQPAADKRRPASTGSGSSRRAPAGKPAATAKADTGVRRRTPAGNVDQHAPQNNEGADTPASRRRPTNKHQF